MKPNCRNSVAQKTGCRWLVSLLITALPVVFLLAALRIHAQGTQGTNRFVIRHPWPGGVDPHPLITSIKRNGGVTLEWFGFQGPYQVQGASSLLNPVWSNVVASTQNRSATVPFAGDIHFFRVAGGLPGYTGAETCAECHESAHAGWSQTRHARALETLKNIGQDRNAACLACHTVGFGTSFGFQDELTTPHLAGVQCESCHGPAANHAARPSDLRVRPAITPSATMCGGCHNRAHHPTFDEWNTAGHGHVTPTPASYFLSTSSVSRMLSCGACHSGAVRLSMLKNNPLPLKQDAAEISVTCAVCHDSHGNTGHAAQLRNPTFSTNFFSYNTSTNTTFAAQYKANVNMCGQCHNQRGALPTDSSRPPHHSGQYNMLIGQITAPDAALWPLQTNRQMRSSHTLIQAQCTQCHTHAHPVENPDIENAHYTGHDFRPRAESCVECHTSETQAEALKAQLQTQIRQRIQEVKAKLDLWGQTKAPEALRTRYGALAWEYTSAGQISNPTGNPTITGPSSTEQPSVPQAIKDARFYLYMVEHDGSYGVHNSKYARFLLSQSERNVQSLLDAP